MAFTAQSPPAQGQYVVPVTGAAFSGFTMDHTHYWYGEVGMYDTETLRRTVFKYSFELDVPSRLIQLATRKWNLLFKEKSERA